MASVERKGEKDVTTQISGIELSGSRLFNAIYIQEGESAIHRPIDHRLRIRRRAHGCRKSSEWKAFLHESPARPGSESCKTTLPPNSAFSG
jgi:hypothetical protein